MSSVFEGFVDLLDGNVFDIGGDAVLAAEVKHLLGLPDAAEGNRQLSAAGVAAYFCIVAHGLQNRLPEEVV